MNKNYVVHLFVVAGLLAFFACSSVPTRRTHAVASLPRLVDINYSNFASNPERTAGVGGSAGIGYGIAYSDVGNVHNSRIVHFGIHYRHPQVAFGWTPFVAHAQVSHEGTGMIGSVLWAAVHFGGGNRWRYSYQNTFTMASKVAEEQGCEDDYNPFFTSCAGKPVSTARSEVRMRDVGFIFTADLRVGEKDSILFAPAAYWTWISASNKLDHSSVGDFHHRTSFWSPGMQIGYVSRIDSKLLSSFTILAGAQWAKTFRPGRVVREWTPTADARFQF